VGKMPAFQFYPGDWMKDPCVRRCSHAARGVWVDMLCLMFECSPRGVLGTGSSVWSVDDVTAAVGGNADVTRKAIVELVEKCVCSVDERGAFYSRRMVRDEEDRKSTKVRVAKHRKNGKENISNGSCNADVTPMLHRSSSSSSSSITLSHSRVVAGFDSMKFSEAWTRWRKHLAEQQKPLTETAEESQIMALDRAAKNETEAIEIIEFSMTKGAKNLLLNGDHRTQEPKQFPSGGRFQKSPPKIPIVAGADA